MSKISIILLIIYGIGGGNIKIKRQMLIAMFLAIMMIAGTSGAFAVEGDGTTPDGSTDPGTTLTPDSTDTCSTDTCSTDTCSTDTCSTDTPETSTAPASSGDVSADAMAISALWIWASDVSSLNPSSIIGKYTDVYVLTRGGSGASYISQLRAAMDMLQPAVRVHAWIICFRNNNQFMNPSGYYTYTVPVYLGTKRTYGWKRIAYKTKRGKIRYRYRKGWTYTPQYRYDTYSGYDKSFVDSLYYFIRDVSYVRNSANTRYVDGVQLDWVRYSGVGSNAAASQPGGWQAGSNTITTFVKDVKNGVRSGTILSAAVMPEYGSGANNYYYGQDYAGMGQYLNYLVPMVYKGNYGKDTNWIGTTVYNIRSISGWKPVVAGLQTYRSDSNPTRISAAELHSDINSADLAGGAYGFALFRYGLIDPAF